MALSRRSAIQGLATASASVAMEDLVLIGKDGPELLNPTSDRFIVI